MYSTKNISLGLLNRRLSLLMPCYTNLAQTNQNRFTLLSSGLLSSTSPNQLVFPLRIHSFSSLQNIKPIPESLTSENVERILDITRFYCHNGRNADRFHVLAESSDRPLSERWHLMVKIYKATQVYVIEGLGYDSTPEGLKQYELHLAQCLQKVDPTTKQLLEELRRKTFREIVGTVFKIDPENIPVISHIEARDLMRKVSSRMVEPDILRIVQNRVAQIRHADKQTELIMKHQLLQQIIIDEVYLGGNPSLVEEAGFGSGEIGYIKKSCAMAEHDGDPLITSESMPSFFKILAAAGVGGDKS